MNSVNATDVIFIFHARSKQFLGHVSNKKGLLRIDMYRKKMKIHKMKMNNFVLILAPVITEPLRLS